MSGPKSRDAPGVYRSLLVGNAPMIRQCFFLLLFTGTLAAGEAKHATPLDYRQVIANLQAGDTLTLAAGVYERGLPLTNCAGRPDAWITVQGPETGVAEIRQTAVANCVELRNCHHLALKRLSILGEGPEGIPGLFGISAKGGNENPVHDILIEDCLISDWNTSQQAVGISTKVPAWNWTIRRNIIRNCGTGLYLGNSNGNDPFIAGVIEHNLVDNPTGYCLEIKFQNPRPVISGMPSGASRTLIRHNVFIKDDRPSPDGDRPNVLVGGFPESGPGAGDGYEIHGNLFLGNPRESQLQASGRVGIHDNVFANCASTHAAVTLRDHDRPLFSARVYHNTLFDAEEGIRVVAKEAEKVILVGNVIFTRSDAIVLKGVEATTGANITGSAAEAVDHLANPAGMELHPLPDKCSGLSLDPRHFQEDSAATVDFDGRSKGAWHHRGAFATNREGLWKLQAGIKP